METKATTITASVGAGKTPARIAATLDRDDPSAWGVLDRAILLAYLDGLRVGAARATARRG